jgi:hypothetical protein
MSLGENMGAFGIPGASFSSDIEEEVHSQCIEMGQLKSDFDIQKYTLASKGPFLASQFHMLMRQYSLAKYEMVRMMLDKDELQRKIHDYEEQLKTCVGKKITIFTEKGMEERYLDIELARCQNQLKLLEITMVNTVASVQRFEQCRKELIRLNGGPITNEQFQAEQPAQQKWMLMEQVTNQIVERNLGIKEGTMQAIEQLKAPALLTSAYAVPFLVTDRGQIDICAELQSKVQGTLSNGL